MTTLMLPSVAQSVMQQRPRFLLDHARGPDYMEDGDHFRESF